MFYSDQIKALIDKRPWIRKISFLGLIEALGGLLLTLVFGLPAWADTDSGRSYRLCAGALSMGVVLGTIYYKCFPDALSSLIDPSATVWIAFAGFPILFLVVTFFLNSLRRNLD